MMEKYYYVELFSGVFPDPEHPRGLCRTWGICAFRGTKSLIYFEGVLINVKNYKGGKR